MRAPILWINGPFGIGKTQLAQALNERLAGSFVFDPEEMGLALRKLTPNFKGETQTHPMWIPLVLDALQYASQGTEGPLIVPVTLTDVRHHRLIMSELKARGLTVHHFTLMAPLEVVQARLRRDPSAGEWDAKELQERLGALQSEQFKTHIDTEDVPVQTIVEQIAAEAGLSLKPLQADPLRWLKATLGQNRRQTIRH